MCWASPVQRPLLPSYAQYTLPTYPDHLLARRFSPSLPANVAPQSFATVTLSPVSSAVEPEPRYVCNFEEDTCDLMVYRDHMDMDLYFRRDSGATETPGTGPSFDHTLGPQQRGHYIYMDSPGFVAGASATMLGRPAIYPPGVYCVRFFYHMWGDDVNSLRMYMHALEHDKDITGDWGKPQVLRIGDHGDEWLEGGFEFRSDGYTAQQLVIEALAGFSEKGDIAIDDLSLSGGRCEEHITRDAYQGDYICGEVRLLSGNWTEEKSWYVEGAVSCAGRGYSYDSLRGSWMPCCVPRYGDYTLVLHDGYGDGWSGSKMEFRFFDETQTFGEDFLGIEQGVEKKYTLNIGLVHLAHVEGSSDSIRLQVQVAQPQSYVWCGAALAASPAPTVEVLKKYGIRSQSPTISAGQKVLLEIKNKPNTARVLQPHTDYNIYCYAEPAAAASLAASASSPTESPQSQELHQELKQHQHSLKYMDDDQVAASRTPVTTDNEPPVITLERVDVAVTAATLHLHVDEPCTVYCLPIELDTADASVQPPTASAFKGKHGTKISILKGAEFESHTLHLPHLSPDTFYKVFCYAEDRALPRPNKSSAEDVKASALDVQTPTKVPELSIVSYEAFVRGFRLQVKSDTPAKVWCAAAMSGSAYPKKEDVKRVGATAEIQDIAKPATVEIRGVPPNTRYSIYCVGASRSGSAETRTEQMWEDAFEVTSFGKFCEMPLTPPVLSEGPRTPFDPITPAEEHLVRDFLRTQQQLKLEGVYRVNLFADKEAILNHYEKGAAFPPRYARVRAGSCDMGKGAFRQFKIGPLPESSEEEAAAAAPDDRARRGMQQLELEEIGNPVETDCGGYNPQGVFGRRLLAEEEEDGVDALLFDVFGLHFGKKTCRYEKKGDVCAVYGPFFFKQGANGDLEEIWIGLKAFTSPAKLKRLLEKRHSSPQTEPLHQKEDINHPQADLQKHDGEQAVLEMEQRRQALHGRNGAAAKREMHPETGDVGIVADLRPQEVVYLPFYFVASPHASLRKFDTVSSILLPETAEYIEQLRAQIKGYWMNGLLFDSLENLQEAIVSGEHFQLSPSALREALRGPRSGASRAAISGQQKTSQQPLQHEEGQQPAEQECAESHLSQRETPQEDSPPHSNEEGDLSEFFHGSPLLWGASPPRVAPLSVLEKGRPAHRLQKSRCLSSLSRRLQARLQPRRLPVFSRPAGTESQSSPAREGQQLISEAGTAAAPRTCKVPPRGTGASESHSTAVEPSSPRLTTELVTAKPTPSQDVPLPGRRLSELYPTGSTAGSSRAWPGPDPRGRGGLEYRAGPEHIEPQGKRYTIKHNPLSTSYTIEYLGWTMTVTNDRDTSLRIWNLRFNGERYAFEAGVNEALAHYSVAERHWYFMDSWYGGLGAAARRVHAGIECTKTATILFYDQTLCVFEQDKARPLRSHWKAGALRDAAPHYVLVLRQIITVSNYDYITDYVFHASGVFEATMAFTGELYAGVEVPWFSARQAHHGTQVTGSMRMGALHAHLASWKVDIDLDDYKENSVLWHEVKKDPARPGALRLETWIAETEEQAYFKFNDTRPLQYQVIHEDHNVYGNMGGLTVLPLPTIAIPNPDFELFTGPAAWAKYRILTTLRKEEEYHGSLPRDNKYALRPAVSLDRFIRDNDRIRKKDLVTWVASAVWHIPVIEDMPQTLSLGNTLGFMVKPHNYFTEDVSMDLHNALGGAVQDPGTCAIIRQELDKFLAE